MTLHIFRHGTVFLMLASSPTYLQCDCVVVDNDDTDTKQRLIHRKFSSSNDHSSSLNHTNGIAANSICIGLSLVNCDLAKECDVYEILSRRVS